MPASIKYDNQFTTLVTLFAFNRAFSQPEESNKSYEKLVDCIDEYVNQRVQIALNKVINHS
jgi:hypothetical protein